MILGDDFFMREALKEAQIAFDEGEVPVGAVVVCNNHIIARAHNQTERLNDVTAHAEMLAITAAANHLNSKYLKDCSLYVTLEPCPMCAGALAWAQVGRIVFSTGDNKKGFRNINPDMLHPKTKLSFGNLEFESGTLLVDFFKAKRKS